MLLMEPADILRITRHQRGADKLRKLQNGQFFRMVPQSTRLVEHPSALTLGLLQ